MHWLQAAGFSLFAVAAGCAGDRAVSWRAQRALAQNEGAVANVQAATTPAPLYQVPAAAAPAETQGVIVAQWVEPARLSPTILQSKSDGAAGPELPEDRERVPAPRKVENTGTATARDGDRLHIDELDVRKALEIISRNSAVNIVISPGVDGKITADLKGLSPDRALDVILKAANLVAQRDKGIVYVYTPEEIRQAAERDQPLPIRVYHLNYIRSTDLAKMVKPLLTKSVGQLTTSPPSEVGIPTSSLSPGSQPQGGSQSPNSTLPSGNGTPTNGMTPTGGAQPTGGVATTGGDSLAGGDVVIVQDREAVLQTVDRIVAQLDVQPPQVLIEAEILSVELDKTHELGVNFGVLDGSRLLGIVGNGALLNATAGFSPAAVVNASGQVAGSTSGFAEDSHGIKFGFVGKNVTGFIKALDTIGKTEVLACPRILVLNKQRGEFQLGDRLGYRTLTQNGTSTIEQIDFLDVGTLLRVRPFVTSNGIIRMEIHPERSTGQVVNDIPQTNTSQVTSNVLVPDGMTIVIGGLMENEETDNRSGVPFLSGLRGIGALFRQHTHTSTKKELIVLLTPRIWNPIAAGGAAPPQSCTVPPAAIVQTAASQPAPAAARTFLQLYVSQSPEPVRVGEEAIYEIKVVNVGQQNLQGIAVSAALTPGLQAVGTEAQTKAELADHQVVFQLLSQLEPQAQAVYRVRARATAEGPQSIHVRLSSLSVADSQSAGHETQVLAPPPVVLGQPQAVWRPAASNPSSP